jgi:aminomethyltransferase
MVPFSGWQMPIQYEGVVAEHLHTRSAAGLFDLSHMGRLQITGPDAEALIQQATTNDAARLKPGAIQYSLMCNAQGGVREDLLVYRFERGWWLVVNASNREKVIQLLEELRAEQHLQADTRDGTFEFLLLGLQGPSSEDVLQPVVDADLSTLAYYHARQDRISLPGGVPGQGVIISRTGYTGEDGFEVMAPIQLAAALWDVLISDQRVHPIGLGARDTLRLEAGMALYGHELTEEITPYEARLGRVVRVDKGPFVGREALAALREQTPERRLVGLEFGPGAVPRAGFAVWADGVEVGEVASGTFSPTLRRPIATAYVRTDRSEPGSELQVAIRDTRVPASVVSLPFVPHRTRPAAARS